MAQPRIEPATFIEDSGWTALARIELPSGAIATQATITSIAYTVHNGTTQTASGAIVVATSVFDAIQGAAYADARWDKDATGYNFRFEIPASAFPSPGKDYRVEIKFTPVTGEVFHVLWGGACEGVRGS